MVKTSTLRYIVLYMLEFMIRVLYNLLLIVCLNILISMNN